jgi:hypothetical protein
VSPRETTLEQDYQEAFDRARTAIIPYRNSRNLILLLNENKIIKLSSRNQRDLKKLAQLGVINLYMDNTVSLSKLGKDLARTIRHLHSIL